jgi:hypothetical protein
VFVRLAAVHDAPCTAGNESLESAINWLAEHGEDADIDVPLEIDPASVKTKLSKEEQQKLLEERLAKMRADKARQEKELEKQQELSRIQMNKELNEVPPAPPLVCAESVFFSRGHVCWEGFWHVSLVLFYGVASARHPAIRMSDIRHLGQAECKTSGNSACPSCRMSCT